MNSRNTLPISEARKRIFAIANDVQKPGQHYTLTEKGKPKAVVMSAEEFESWQETIEVMGDPQALKAMRRAEKEYAAGDYITLDDFFAAEGFMVADKGKRKYAVSSNSRPKRPKRTTHAR